MTFSDIHIHLLYGVDDGTGTCEEMKALTDYLYSYGTRYLCVTPHCCPAMFGDNRASTEQSFLELKTYCAEKYPDLALSLGNELYCSVDNISWIKSGYCNTLGLSRFVLLEFDEFSPVSAISKATKAALNSGYVPIIAHTERYIKLGIRAVEQLRRDGARIQVNTVADLGGALVFGEKHRLNRLLKKRLVDFASTDAHNINTRKPYMVEFYNAVAKKYGEEYAKAICCLNAAELLFNKTEDLK